MIHDQDLLMFLWARDMQHNNLQLELISSQDLGVQGTRGGIHWCEAYGESFLHLSLFSLYPKKRTKLEPSNGEGFFLGYNESSEAYIIYVPKQRKSVVSKDTKFEGNFASKKSHEPIPMT